MYSSIALLLGHCVGDYWFQNHKMAVNKSKPGLIGIIWCNVHCIIYSICVAIFVVFGGWNCKYLDNNLHALNAIMLNILIVFIIAYVTHYPIDRVSLAFKWMKWFGQSSFKDIDGELFTTWNELGDPDSTNVKIDKRQYFIAPIYIAIDNSMHLVLMWILLSVLGK